jgi:hypothetical protein
MLLALLARSAAAATVAISLASRADTIESAEALPAAANPVPGCR